MAKQGRMKEGVRNEEKLVWEERGGGERLSLLNYVLERTSGYTKGYPRHVF